MICPADELPAPLAAPRLANHLMHTSGGLRWHLTALRRRAREWSAFRNTLAHWLDAWRPPCARLLLIGPSAGWTLPDALFTRFDEIRVLEPDPLARLALARRIASPRLHFDTLDVFAPGGLATLRTQYADHAVLFCNLLGQVAPDGDNAAWYAGLRQALAGLHWASWHDIASSARPVDRHGVQTIAAGTPFDALIAHFWQGGTIEVTDHGSFALAHGEAFACTDWPLRDDQHHLVGWISHTPDAG
ncbi:hypothetical protein GCM10025771_11240 [Niveibacterium umoris]|uniref:Class I SAM-dependent methyltransferase n=1 Tax=Niveibacterium umoris TaxID=1193620 RepID=A0A840BLJ6_9RHOO|nr:hypothetical protein [Niveibacterium umoris]MBB4013324.1 hypothetical protein [Niveibacterium umoris]